MFSFNVQEDVVFAREEFTLVVQIQMLAGVLLVVQGFETSRFLGDKYKPEVRIKSMRIAQWISGVIYIVSVFLLLPVLTNVDLFNVELSSIISAMAPVAFVLPAMLMLAALMSQFSGSRRGHQWRGWFIAGEQSGHPVFQSGLHSSVNICGNACLDSRSVRYHRTCFKSLCRLLLRADGCSL